MKFKKLALAISTLILSSGALAHGYIEVPQSRAYKCKLQQNVGCGAIQYEPQSIEQTSGFPTGPMPRDGELASGSIPNFSPLDKQSVNAWGKNEMKPGINQLTWFHTALHKTNNWRYYITKQNWDQNKPLTRDSFESTPFCQVEGHGEAPPERVTHTCNVPQRTGYQVIYGVWEVNDTVNSFHQAVDVNFGDDQGPIIPEWSTQLSGHITGKDLRQGDKVIARFFDDQGEAVAKNVEMTIVTQEQTDKNRWSYDLANLINSTHSDIRVGVKDGAGNVNPVHGTNNVYVKKDSRLTKVLISYDEQSSEITEEISVSGVQVSKIQDGQAALDFNVQVTGEVTFEATVIDHHGAEKGYVKQTLADTSQPFTLTLKDVKPGHHMIKYFATNKDGKLIKQDVIDLNLEDAGTGGGSGNHEYVFPADIAKYKAGTVVLQPKDGKTYECKPFPYSGYCIQWNTNANQFEPGVGSNWQDAWTLKK